MIIWLRGSEMTRYYYIMPWYTSAGRKALPFIFPFCWAIAKRNFFPRMTLSRAIRRKSTLKSRARARARNKNKTAKPPSAQQINLERLKLGICTCILTNRELYINIKYCGTQLFSVSLTMGGIGCSRHYNYTRSYPCYICKLLIQWNRA